MNEKHVCKPPESSDFRDGKLAEGCWMQGVMHFQQIAGESGVYLIVTDTSTGLVTRDDTPWQMEV
jgi:hypothetical protein